MSKITFDLQRFATINNKADNTLVSGTSSDDKITNSAANVTIAAGGGNDSIVNKEYADNISVSGGKGNDTIKNTGEYSSNTTITGDDGNDFILNNSYGVTIDGGAGKDTISNSGQYATLHGGKGNDSITNSGENVLFKYSEGDGNDVIGGFNATSSLQIGDGSATYTEKTSGNNIIITVGTGKITLQGAVALGNINVIGKKLDPLRIPLTERADNYSNYREGAIIEALAGNDSIYNDGSYSSISGGVGNDTIYNYYADYSSIEGGLGNDSIYSSGNDSTINGGDANDTIYNYYAHYSSIEGGSGNDSIYNYSGNNSTINGGDGNDTIYNRYANNVTIDGGAGNDYIDTNGGSKLTIDGGAGNDIISLSSSYTKIHYKSGDGNDIIYGFDSNDTLQIGDGNDTYSSTVSGDNVILTVGKGKISLIGAAGSSLYIDGTAAYKGHKYRVFNDNMDWEEAKAYCEKLGGHLVTIKDKAENDFVYSLAKQGSNSNYWLGGYRDDNDVWQWVTKETFSYSNWELGQPDNYNNIENCLEMYQSISSWNDMPLNSNRGFICEWEGATTSSSKATLLTVNDSTKSPLTIGSAVKIVDGTERTKAIKITGNALANSIVGGSGKDSLYGGDGKDTLAGGKGNDKLYGKNGNDVLSGGQNNDTLVGGAGNDTFVHSGGNDVITDYASGDKISILGAAIDSASLSGNNVIFTIGSNKLTVKDAKKKTLTIINAAGKESQTVFGAATLLTASNSTKSPLTIGAAVKTVDASKRTKAIKITGNALDNSIVGGSGKDSLYGGDGKDTLEGGKGNDKLYGKNGNDYLNGGDGNDVLSGGQNNNTLVGGAGNDTFVHSGGNDLITDYAAGDKISVLGAAVDNASLKGNDVIFTIGSNKLTVTGGRDKTISYIDSEGKHTYSASSSNVSIDGSTIKLLPTYLKDSFDIADYGEILQNIDASEVLLDMKITGNVLRNSILGGENNETLIGDKGNDTLTGGEGSDIFVYSAGDGNDIITDYTVDDTISIASGEISDVSVSGSDVIFKIGSGKITVNNAKDKVISYIDADGNPVTYPQTVIINGTTAKLTESYMSDSFKAADYKSSLAKIDASAVTHELSITGNKLANKIVGSNQNDYIDGDAGGDSIQGGDGNDTLSGGKGNDTLTGGNGSDIFLYNSGDGDDLITDYAEEDKINIASGTIATIKKSSKDVIFTVGSNKITVKGAASKTVTYIDASGKTNYFPTTPSSAIIWKDSNKTAILRETYSEKTFTASDYNASIKTIDASSITHNLSITGNGKANVILGGEENDTINGGKGNDTLQGGSGADTFLYANGDGKDLVVDYAEEDTIKITKGTAKISTSGSDVVFTIGSGKITVSGAANKTVNYIDANGKKKTYGGSASNVAESWFIADDDNFATSNDLSALIQNKSSGHFVADNSTALAQKNNLLPSITCSSKK